MRVAGLILAAGGATRFGGPKAIARLEGRPLLEHSLAAALAASLDPIVVVLGAAADDIETAIEWGAVRRVRNPDPGRGLASSLAIGVAAVAASDPPVDAIAVLLGDQPRTEPAVIRSLIGRLEQGGALGRPIAVPRYADGGHANPVLVARAAFGLVAEARGDRGLGPLIRDHPELVDEVEAGSHNPDVDTRADLARLIEAGWAARVRANREQVERVREVPDGPDFYRPISDLFVTEPRRTGDPVLAALLEIARPGDVVLDIGAGAGRYALPLALAVREVIALDPSASMLAALEDGMRRGGIANVRPIRARWPLDPGDAAGPAAIAQLGPFPLADVALLAHVGYDVEAIGPFIEAMEAAARRSCVAILMERSPASLAAPLWPAVHNEERVPLPALPDFLELLEARGRSAHLQIVESERRRWRDPAELEAFARRQTWTATGSAADRRLVTELERRITVEPDGSVSLGDASTVSIGVVSWSP